MVSRTKVLVPALFLLIPFWAACLDRSVGVILLTKGHQFTRDLAEELSLRGPEVGIHFDFDWAEFDADKESQIVDKMIAHRYDAVLLTPADSGKIDPCIDRLNTAGIPVFTVDIASEGSKGTIVSHITSDNFLGGMAAAALMAEALRGRGQVVIINHPKITSVQERVAGFKKGIEAWPDLQIVADVPSWGQRTRAQSITDDFMMMMPDIQGIFAINDESVMGALKSLKASGKAGQVVLVGYDGTPEVKAEIDRGLVFADVVQYPRQLARQSVRALADFFAGKSIPKRLVVPTGIVRK